MIKKKLFLRPTRLIFLFLIISYLLSLGMVYFIALETMPFKSGILPYGSALHIFVARTFGNGYPFHVWKACPDVDELAKEGLMIECVALDLPGLIANSVIWFLFLIIVAMLVAAGEYIRVHLSTRP